VGGVAIEAEQVRQALDLCAQHEPERKPDECVNTFWVPRWLLDREAQMTKVAQAPEIAEEIADILHRGLIGKLATPDAAPLNKEVDDYLKRNRRDFEKPLRLRLFRILLNSEEEAEELRRTLTKDTSVEEFRKLAREKSVDQATHERGGDLGFVWPDGSTDVPQVRVKTALYEAALPLSDGELAPKPIAEDGRFAILWRRGSKPEVPLNDESRQVAKLRVLEQRRDAEVTDLLDRLKTAHVKGRSDILLGKLRRKEASLFSEP
jgi:hypothetical protein